MFGPPPSSLFPAMDSDPKKTLFVLAWLVLASIPLGRLLLPALTPLVGG